MQSVKSNELTIIISPTQQHLLKTTTKIDQMKKMAEAYQGPEII